MQVDVVFVVVGDGYPSFPPASLVTFLLPRMFPLPFLLWGLFLLPVIVMDLLVFGQVELSGVSGVEVWQIVPPSLAFNGRTDIDNNTIFNTPPSNPLHKYSKLLFFNYPNHNLR